MGHNVRFNTTFGFVPFVDHGVIKRSRVVSSNDIVALLKLELDIMETEPSHVTFHCHMVH